MATMVFDRIVPSGKNAYWPFQMSAASLNPTAVVYVANDASGADSTLASGVSVDDMGGGLYALKVLSANMTADNMYYAVVTSGSESVRIPLWAYAPANHIATVLADLATVDGVVDGIASELGDVSAQSFSGISAPATVAAALAEIFNKVDGVQDDLDNATDGLGALKSLIDTIDSEVGALQGDVTSILADTGELQTDWADGGRLDALLDRTVAASEAAEDLIGLAADTSAAATVFGKIAALSGDLATVDSNVDAIKAAVEDATYGLSALETRLDSVDTDLGNIESKLDTVDSVVDSIETKVDTIDGVVDGLATEIGDVSAVFAGGAIAGNPVSVAEGLKKIYDNLAGTDVWAEDLASYTTAGTAGYLLREAHEELTSATYGLDAIKTETAAIAGDVTAIDSKLGAPAGATMSADIAAIKAVVDTLQVSTNARLTPSVPSEVYSAASAFRVRFGLNIHDGETGSLEDPDTFGTGQALILAQTIGGGSNPTLYNASSAGSALSNNDQTGFTSWFNMNRQGTGRFEAWAEIPAYFNKSVQVSFLCFDSDPLATQQTFTSERFMVVRSPIQSSAGGGAF
jgi:hypothetical protein